MPERLPWLVTGALCAVLAHASLGDSITIAEFSRAQPRGGPPAGWTVLSVAAARAPNTVELVEDGGATVLRVDSKHSASGITRRLRADPAQHPMLRWRWKISNVIRGADISHKDSDDFPARLYVMFDYPIERLPFGERVKLHIARALYDPNLPAATLCYVWDDRTPAGTIVASSYSARVRLIVAESGSTRVNRWVDFERDIAADFRAAFGEEPPEITAVAVATDTDNTGEAVTAHFGDISLHKRPVIR